MPTGSVKAFGPNGYWLIASIKAAPNVTAQSPSGKSVRASLAGSEW